jgi:glycosyltransferase involved in cell wall biosynthesis
LEKYNYARLIHVELEKITRHNVFLIDPKNVLFSGGLDTLNRHNFYAEKLKNKGSTSQSNKFGVICVFDKEFKNFLTEFTYLIPTYRNLLGKHLSFLSGALKILRKDQSDSILLISGDPWQAAIYCLIFKLLIKKKIKVQMQVHADIGDRSWKKESVKNYIKFYICTYTLPKADSIRCVSEAQLKKINSNLKLDGKKIFSSGIVYNIPSKEATKNKMVKIPTIGFMGRLEIDRGIWDFVKIIKKLNSTGAIVNIKVAGVGRYQSQFINKLKEVNSGDVDYLGQLSANEISIYWESIDLSIFTAPTESFGRGMRESLSNNVPIWAVNSSGFEDLKSKFTSDEIMQIDPSDTGELLEKKLKISINLKMDYDYADYFTREQKMNLDGLIQSWVVN